MKKILLSLSLCCIFSIFLIPNINASQFENDTTRSGKITLSDGSSNKTRSMGPGSKKVDGYWWHWGSSWNTVQSNYDNNQPHSASTRADWTYKKASTNKSNARVMSYQSSQIQYIQEVYYNYW